MIDKLSSFFIKTIPYGDFITNGIIAIFAIFQGVLFFAEKRREKFVNDQVFQNAYPRYAFLLHRAEIFFAIIILVFVFGLILQYLKLKGVH